MKSMKPMLVAALVVGSLLACSTATFAQAGGAPGGAPGAGAPGGGRGGRGGAQTSDAMITRFQTALGDTNKLSDVVVAKIKPILDDMIKKRTDLMAGGTADPADLQTKMTAITTAASDAIKAIVTPAQFAIIQPLLQRGGRGGGRRGGGGGGGGGGAPAPAPGN
jgi:hypothetical protein